MSDVLLRVQNLKKYYPVKSGIFLRQVGRVHAVDDISFEVKRGETLGLVGESGCGKSTIAKTILRLYEPTAGEVFFAGQDILQLGKQEMRSLRQEMQIIFQDPSESLNARHTIGSILEEPFVIHGIGTAIERKRWVLDLLRKVGLQEDVVDRFPHEFSGGQRQRIGIARAIALKPQLILCDEPVSALDVSIQSQILNLLLDLQKEMDLTLLFIAHDLAVVKHVSDRIAVMYLGKIVEIGDAESIYKQPLHPYTQSLIASVPVPDPKQRKAFHALQGDVPSPINPPSGCRFHTRCQFAKEQCKTEIPELHLVDNDIVENGEQSKQNGHLVACHFAGKVFLNG